MTAIACLIFFLSGASALIFEVLWFQLCGITFGNSIWSTTIVVGSFMLGLGLGNGLIAFKGKNITWPFRFYAGLEIAIGVSGFCVVLLLPVLTNMLAPLFRLVLDKPLFINFFRLLISFSIMAISTTAMGATLPVLVKALYAATPEFGTVLGKLYGFNTLGAMAGVIAADALLIRICGIKGAGLFASGLNFFAAAVALYLSKKTSKENFKDSSRSSSRLSQKAIRLLTAGFLSGFTVLALEVIWFRFIILFFTPHAWNFCMMLAAVLLGIGLGGLLASQWSRRSAMASRYVFPLFLANGAIIVFLYAFFGHVYSVSKHYPPDTAIILNSLFLIFPVCLISGVLFTMIGKALHAETGEETKSAGLLTLSNTMGGLAGSTAGALVFIPCLGIETSFFTAALLYGAVGLLLVDWKLFMPVAARLGFCHWAASILLIISLFLFPFGRMNPHYLDLSLGRYMSMGAKRVAAREDLTETIQCLRKDILDKPYFHLVMTNNHSMSSTFFKGKRYMKLYVYLPAALHEGLKNALLIGYGCGSTAKALTDTKSLRTIDVVDISADIIEMSRYIYPDPNENPAHDPRVRVHIEDGRFFLLTTGNKYDLITAEPPPPKNSGIVNLYTQEYFQLLYDRLADGGYVTYWLPVYQFTESEAKAVVKAFQNVFSESSLWTASEYEWMLLGVKNPGSRVSKDAFARQWQDASVAPEMHSLGFTSPEQIGSLFIADHDQLGQWLSGGLSLIDNFPFRLSHKLPDEKTYLPLYGAFVDPKASCNNFVNSKHIKKIWPEAMIQASVKYFDVRQTINELITNDRRKTIAPEVLLDQAINNPLLQGDFILWALQSDAYAQNIISANMGDIQRMIREGDMQGLIPISGHLAARLAQQGDYLTAEKYIGMGADAFGPNYLWNSASQIREFLLRLAAKKEQAGRVK